MEVATVSFSGTSMSSPHDVACVIAKILSEADEYDGEISPLLLEHTIQVTLAYTMCSGICCH